LADVFSQFGRSIGCDTDAGLNQKLIDAVNIVSSGWGDIATDVAEAITHLLETPNSIDVDSFDKLEDAVELGFRIALGDEGFSLLHSLNLAPTTPQQGSEPSL
jgi:hypothetical protein